MTDYVRWMGSLTFEEKPFCDADAAVLCNVVYFAIFDKETSPGRTLREVTDASPVEDTSIVKRLGGGLKEHPAFIRAVADSRRYGEIRVRSSEETLDNDQSIQFAAVTFSYRDLINFVAFRGTDDTIAGWKEDFMISFTKTAAQDMALEYVKANLAKEGANYIGGHSKGGNLALYAASMLPDELVELVTHVYDLDGPGFCDEVFDMKTLDKIRDRTTFIIPEFSIIGKLFEPDIPDKKIAASSETAVMQHELLSWGTTSDGMDTVSESDKAAEEINHIIDSWVEGVPLSERQTFVDELFDALSEDGAETMSDLMRNGPDGFEQILFRVLGMSRSAKKTAAALPEQALLGDIPKKMREKGFMKRAAGNRTLQSIMIIAGGIITMAASDRVLDILTRLLFIGLTALQIYLTINRAKENGWHFEKVSERLQLCLILTVITICMFFKRAAAVVGSVLFLIIVISAALYAGVKMKDSAYPIHIRILSAMEWLAGNVFAVLFLIIPQENVFAFPLGVGICLILDGCVRLLFERLEARRILRPSAENE